MTCMNHFTFSTLLNALYQGSVGELFKLWLMMKHSQKVMMVDDFIKNEVRMDGEWTY